MATKLTSLIYILLWLIIVLRCWLLLSTLFYNRLRFLINGRRFTLSTSYCIIVINLSTFLFTFDSLWINISSNSLFLLLSLYLLIKCSSIYFSKQALKLFHLSRSQLIQILHYSIPHKPIQLCHAFISHIPNILQLMLYSLHHKLNSCLTLLIWEFIFLEHLQQNRILSYDMFVRKDCLFSIFCSSWGNRSSHYVKNWLNTKLGMLCHCH